MSFLNSYITFTLVFNSVTPFSVLEDEELAEPLPGETLATDVSCSLSSLNRELKLERKKSY